jgi:hypothetical protein
MTAATSVPSASGAIPRAVVPGPARRRTAETRGQSWWSRPAGPRTSGTRPPAAPACPLRRRFRARERPRQPLADQLLRGPVGHRHQVHVALVLGLDALRKKLAQPRARLARNGRSLGNPHHFDEIAAAPPLTSLPPHACESSERAGPGHGSWRAARRPLALLR